MAGEKSEEVEKPFSGLRNGEAGHYLGSYGKEGVETNVFSPSEGISLWANENAIILFHNFTLEASQDSGKRMARFG